MKKIRRKKRSFKVPKWAKGAFAGSLFAAGSLLPASQAGKIVHDAEYYILEAQNGKKWAVEDKQLDKKLAELRKKYKNPPNIIHFMWDDQPVMAFGDPLYQKIRGYSTPNLNKLAADGMMFAFIKRSVATRPRTSTSWQPMA
jgi:arylsulfatase